MYLVYWYATRLTNGSGDRFDRIILFLENAFHLLDADAVGVEVHMHLMGGDIHAHAAHTFERLQRTGDRVFAVLTRNVWNVEDRCSHACLSVARAAA